MPIHSNDDRTTAPHRAVVLVSGVLSHSPFTTPEAACATGLAAGNTDTFLRQHLLDAGIAVYTAPQRVGEGTVEESEDPVIGPFGSCPAPLPASMTVNTIATLDEGARRLAAFLAHLHEAFAVTEVDLVGHSLGGLLARALIAEVRSIHHPVTVRSLTTIGSPWEEPMISDALDAEVSATKPTDGPAATASFAEELVAAGPAMRALRRQVGPHHAEWAESLAGTLDGIPVLLLAGSWFTKEGGDPSHWPNDGAIQLVAATAANVPDRLLPDRRVHVLPLTHSTFVSADAGLGPETALTWSPEVGRILVDFLRSTGWSPT